MKPRILLFVVLLFIPAFAIGQASYKQPPKEIMDVLNPQAIPSTSSPPARDRIAITTPVRNPPIAELAQPMLRLAGERINPNNNGLHRQTYFVKLTLKNISDGKETVVAFPQGAHLFSERWSADGKYLAVGNITPSAIELWIVETATGKASKVKGVQLNTAYGEYRWMPDQRSLLVNLVAKNRGAAPAYEDITPTGPAIQETTGRRGAVQTFEDMLKNPNDEKLFEYYATSQLAVVTLDGKVKEVGQPAIFESADISPDSHYVLTTRIHQPFSYLYPAQRFPKEIEVWDMNGKTVYKVASVPLQDQLPVGGVSTGPRSVSWVPTEAAMLIWAEALDGGNPRNKVTPRDHLITISAPFSAQPAELLKVEQRFQGRQFGENGMMWFGDTNRDTQHRRIFVTDYRNPSNVRMISDLNVNDHYNDIGQPVLKVLPNGRSVIRQSGDDVFLTGVGSSPEGDRPFLRRMNLKTLKSEEIFRSGKDDYESFVAFADDAGVQFVTRHESAAEHPNLYMRQSCPPDKVCTAMAYRPLTEFKDSSPQLRGITKQLVTYKRADGVDLSFTLYLPPS